MSDANQNEDEVVEQKEENVNVEDDPANMLKEENYDFDDLDAGLDEIYSSNYPAFAENLYQVNKERTDKSEHMLPVHFLPEGKKCYDWIKEDLEETDKQKSTCKEKSTTVNSVTYHSAHMSTNFSDVNERDIVQSLLCAAEKDNIEKVQDILRAHPLLINRTDNDGYTALHRACYSGHDNVVLYLLDHGGNVHCKTDDEWQPLHCAARWNNITICKILLEKRADINAKTKGHQTPLHFASLTGDSKEILEMFLLHPDINVNIKNTAGDTAYDLAHRSGPHCQMFEIVDQGLKI